MKDIIMKKLGIVTLSICIVSMLLFSVGCSAPECYPPSKIVGNKCCTDNNDNGVCDLDEPKPQLQKIEEVKSTHEKKIEPDPVNIEVKEEPKIRQVEMPEPVPVNNEIKLGKFDMNSIEKKQYLELNEISAYRSSRDKGVLDEMIFTVRNIGDKELNGVLVLFFDGSGIDYSEIDRIPEYEDKIKKEYTIEKLKPGEKIVFKKSLGIRFQGIDFKKKLTFSIYDKYSAPREDLDVITKEFIPTEVFEDMEIHFFGPEEY